MRRVEPRNPIVCAISEGLSDEYVVGKFNFEQAPDFQYMGITGDHNAQLKIHTTKQIYSSMPEACI